MTVSQEESTLVPSPDEVGHFYDRLTKDLMASIGLDGIRNMHFGYWNYPDSKDYFSEATDRLTDIMSEVTDRLTDIMVDKLKIGPESHVLDVGCGVGGPGVRIARTTGARLTGISVSREQVTLANSLAESAGLAERVVFQQANAMEIPFPAQSFDSAIALESIIHMDRGKVLSQICQSLRPGGRLALTDIFERTPIPAAKRPAMDRNLKDAMMAPLIQTEDYPPLLRDAGLWFEEILDITEHTIPKSHAYILTQINEGVFDDKMARQFDIIGMPEFGYLMLVAKRPKE
jgi:O-methyltransferase StaMB